MLRVEGKGSDMKYFVQTASSIGAPAKFVVEVRQCAPDCPLQQPQGRQALLTKAVGSTCVIGLFSTHFRSRYLAFEWGCRGLSLGGGVSNMFLGLRLREPLMQRSCPHAFVALAIA